MAIQRAQPPMEVEVEVEGSDAQNITAETELAAHIRQSWERAKFAKQVITERLLQCERQRRGVYDPERAAEIAKTGGSDIYMKLTDVKCRAASAWIKDVMLNMQDRPFSLEPSQEPMLPQEIQMGIIDMVRTEAQEYVAMGAQIHPEAFRTRMEAVHDQIMQKLKDEAKDSARRMEGKIEDQMNQGKFPEAFRDFVDDFVTYPTAILKGPNVKRRKRLTWGNDFTPVVVTDFVREFERVSPFDIYPAPNSSGPNDAYLIQRHRLSRKELLALKGVPGYSDENIEQVLERFGDKGLRQWLMGDQERDNLEGKPHSRLYNDGLIEALEFWGSVSGHMLLQWGMEGEEIEEYKEYEVNAWLIGPYVIKAIINPDPLGRRPYDVAQWTEIPGSFWGTALPEQMRDVQIMCNAAARSLANNMGVASGPQVEVLVDRLPDGEDVTSIYPWKLWQTTSDRTGGGQPAVRFFQPNMNAEALMNVYGTFAKQADEVTGIPNYVYGSSAVSGAGRTASGLSMLMDNAAKGIKTAIVTIDRVVAAIVGRMYTHNMMYDQDNFIKGDFRVVPKGAMGLIQKETLQMRRNEFLQATANPVDVQIVGPEGRAHILRELARGLQIDPDKVVPDEQSLEQQEVQKKAQMLAQQMVQQMMQEQAAQENIEFQRGPNGELMGARFVPQQQATGNQPPGAVAQPMSDGGEVLPIGYRE